MLVMFLTGIIIGMILMTIYMDKIRYLLKSGDIISLAFFIGLTLTSIYISYVTACFLYQLFIDLLKTVG